MFRFWNYTSFEKICGYFIAFESKYPTQTSRSTSLAEMNKNLCIMWAYTKYESW